MHAAVHQEPHNYITVNMKQLETSFCYLDYTQKAGLIHTPDILDILEVQAPSVTEHIVN